MNRRDARCGFTLLELLVAVAITLLLAGLILSVTGAMLGLWRRAQGGFTATTGAKLALDLIERDLHAAHHRPDGGLWFAVSVLNRPTELTGHGWITVASVLKPATEESLRPLPAADPGTGEHRLGEARFGLSGAWLRFIASTPESGAELSLPRAVGYQIARRPVTGSVAAGNPAPLRYTLFRSAVGNADTLAAGYDLDASAYLHGAPTPPAQRSAPTITHPATADALVANVADFGVWLYVRETGGALRRIFPADASDTVHAARGAASPGDAGRMPEVADIMLRVLTEEGAQLIENIETGRAVRPPQYANDAAWWWGVAEAHSRVFIRRIEIKGGAR